MIDQSHNVEGKIDAMIQSVMNIQTAYAKALLVDEKRLADAQRAGDVLGAHRVLLEAFETDVRPLLARLRAEIGVDAGSGRGVPRRRPRRAARARARHRVGRERVRADMTQRSAFVLRVRPDKIDEYVEAHRDVWPEHARRRSAAPASATTRSSATATRCSATSSRTTSSAAAAYLAGAGGRTRAGRTRWPSLLEERVPDAGPPALEEIFRLD